jgi:hypothetical protein
MDWIKMLRVTAHHHSMLLIAQRQSYSKINLNEGIDLHLPA